MNDSCRGCNLYESTSKVAVEFMYTCLCLGSEFTEGKILTNTRRFIYIKIYPQKFISFFTVYSRDFIYFTNKLSSIIFLLCFSQKSIILIISAYDDVDYRRKTQ